MKEDPCWFDQALVPLAFLYVLFVVFGGCGARDWDSDLPNGYRLCSPWSGKVGLASSSGSLLVPANGGTIDKIQVRGDLVVGWLGDASHDMQMDLAVPTGGRWFLVDTRSGNVSFLESESAWRTAIAAAGFKGGPHLAFPSNPLFSIVGGVVGLGFPIAVILITLLAIRWTKRRVRQSVHRN